MTRLLVGEAGNGSYKFTCPVGQIWNLALTGTRSAAVVKIQYSKSDTEFADWATPKSLSAVGELTGTNIGSQIDMRMNVAGANSSDDLIAIFTVVPIK